MNQFIRTTSRISLRLFLLAVLLAGVLAVSGTPTIASASGPTIVIDDFNTGAFTLNGPSGFIIGLPASGAIGGVRDILVQDSGGGSVPSVMSLTEGNGYLNLAVGDSTGTYTIGWGTKIFSSTELNLNASSHDRVVVTLSQVPSSGVIVVGLEDESFPFFNSSQSLSGVGDYTFLFSSFGPGLNPSDIDGIEIVFTGGVSAVSTIRVESIIIRSAPCPAGQYDNGSGCVDADPGYYVPAAGATTQIACDPGTYQPNSGAVSCVAAPAGTYVNISGATEAILCEPGTYQPNTGSLLCLAAEPGNYVSVAGSIAQTACQPGSYQPNTTAISCILADPGYFVDVTGAVEQILCPAGTTSTAGATECTLAVDNTAPTITLTTPTNGATYFLNQAVIADYACQDEAGGSGLMSCVGTVPNGSAIDTSSVGVNSFTVNAADNAGNSNSTAVSYNVVYNFSGFFSPVDMGSTLNVAKAGQSVPLKWRIMDVNGAPVTNLSVVTVSVTSLACDLGETADGIEEYASGSSGLQNLGDGYYQFNWKTPKTYANSCKTLKLNLGEGAGFEHTALFQFKK